MPQRVVTMEAGSKFEAEQMVLAAAFNSGTIHTEERDCQLIVYRWWVAPENLCAIINF